jgi:hypothetical protein
VFNLLDHPDQRRAAIALVSLRLDHPTRPADDAIAGDLTATLLEAGTPPAAGILVELNRLLLVQFAIQAGPASPGQLWAPIAAALLEGPSTYPAVTAAGVALVSLGLNGTPTPGTPDATMRGELLADLRAAGDRVAGATLVGIARLVVRRLARVCGQDAAEVWATMAQAVMLGMDRAGGDLARWDREAGGQGPGR